MQAYANGTIQFKLDDEDLDLLTIEHCRRELQVCIDIYEMESRMHAHPGNTPEQRVNHAINMDNCRNNIETLEAVIKYFGG